MSFLTLKFDCQTVLLSFLFSSCLLLLLLQTRREVDKFLSGLTSTSQRAIRDDFHEDFWSFIPNFSFLCHVIMSFCFVAMRCR